MSLESTNTECKFSQTSTTVGGGCTLSFGGTSAATPMVSGVIALTLEAKYVSFGAQYYLHKFHLVVSMLYRTTAVLDKYINRI